LRLIHRFSDMGYGAQITVSQDICTKTRLRTWGGHGYGHILRNVCHLMNRLAFSPSLVADLLRENPLKLLTLKENVR
jgi:phosphotriesterase-related protein